MAFDVNAARALRYEAKGASFDFVLDGELFSLPIELDVTRLDDLRAATKATAVLDVLLGAESAERLKAHTLTTGDVAAILAEYNKAAGLTVGEDSGSAS